jgi:hypothetical protein
MAFKTKLDTRGLAEYLEHIVKAGQDIDALCDQALVAGGTVMQSGMKQRVPKDTHHLENSIEMSEPRRDGPVHIIEIGLLHADSNTTRYGMAQEYGWADRTGGKAGQSYIRTTAKLDRKKALDAMKRALSSTGAGIE